MHRVHRYPMNFNSTSPPQSVCVWWWWHSLSCCSIHACRIESKHEVTILGGLNEFYVKFFGPSGSESIFPDTEFTVTVSHVPSVCMCVYLQLLMKVVYGRFE